MARIKSAKDKSSPLFLFPFSSLSQIFSSFALSLSLSVSVCAVSIVVVVVGFDCAILLPLCLSSLS